METNRDQLKKTAGGLAGLLVKFGIGETAAKWVANIAIGIAAAAAMTAGVLTLTGCSVSANQTADGAWSYSGIIVLPVEKGGK